MLRDGERERLRPLGQRAYSGTRSWYARRRRRRHARSAAATTTRAPAPSGNYNAGRQYNAWTGNATRGYDRTINGAAGGSGNVARASNYNIYTGQRSTANAASVTRRRRQHVQPRRRDDRRARRLRARRRRLDVQRQHRQDQHWGDRERRQQPLRRRQRQRLQEHRQRLAAAFVERLANASGDTSWADRESQARSTGDDRFGGFSSSEADRFGGGGGFGGGDRAAAVPGSEEAEASAAAVASGAASAAAVDFRWPAIAAARCRHWNRTTLCPCHRRLPRKKRSRRSGPAVTSQPTQEKTES